MPKTTDLQEKLAEFILNFEPDEFDGYDDQYEEYLDDKRKKLFVAS